jgi:CPA2 family monovalent cation:H+ antiporter-2
MAIIMSMAITPVVIALGPHVASGVGRVTWLNRLHNVRAPEEIARAGDLDGHCIVAGYGLAGMEVSTALRKVGTTCIVVDLNPENVRAATRAGFQACFGDVTLNEVLETLGVDRARLLVVAINDLDAALRCIRAACELAPSLHIAARTAYAADFARLQQAGASTVIAAEIESANSLRDTVLDLIEPRSQS